MPLWDMADSTALTVTTIDVTDDTVTGVGTDFVNEVEVGDILILASEEHKVVEVTNSTQLILGTNHTGASGETAAAVARRPTYLTIEEARNTFGVDATEMAAAQDDGKSGFHAGWVQKFTKQRRYANNDTYTVTTYETLVASGSMGGTDLENTEFPNS